MSGRLARVALAFVTLAALAIGGVLCSQIQTMATFLFPLAGALIR